MRKSITYLFIDFLQLSSNRVKLVWATFIAWMFGITWFGAIIPIVREISAIVYRQSGNIKAIPINLDSPAYGATILTLLGTAFGLCVGGYITSNMSTYKNKPQVQNQNIPDISNNQDEDQGDKTK